MLDKYELAAIEHDRSEINRLRDYLREIDPEGEIKCIGKAQTVTDWAIGLLEVRHNG